MLIEKKKTPIRAKIYKPFIIRPVIVFDLIFFARKLYSATPKPHTITYAPLISPNTVIIIVDFQNLCMEVKIRVRNGFSKKKKKAVKLSFFG